MQSLKSWTSLRKKGFSGATAEALGLIACLHSVQKTVERDKMHNTNAFTATQSVSTGLNEFPELTRTTGTMPGTYTNKTDPNTRGVVHPICRQPTALKAKIIEKLHEMVEDGYIRKVDQPTEWVRSMVAVIRNGKIRICIDPSDLN